MRSIPILTAIGLLAMVPSACWQNRDLAVFDIQDQSGFLGPKDLNALTEHLVGGMGQFGKYRVLPRKQTRAQCPKQDPDCLAQAAKQVDAGSYVVAKVVRPGKLCSLVLQYHLVRDTATRFSTSVRAPCDPDGLVGAIDLAVLQLLKPDDQDSYRDIEQQLFQRMMQREREREATEERRRAEEARSALEAPVEPQANQPPVEADPAGEPPKEIKGLPLPALQSKEPTGSETGTLTMDSGEPTEVYVDGRLMGKTPIRLKLPPGKPTVVFEAPDGRRIERKVAVRKGEDLALAVTLPTKEGPESKATSVKAKSLSREVIQRRVKASRGRASRCLELAPKTAGRGTTRVRLEFEILSSGKVGSATAGPKKVPEAVRTCLVEMVSKWKFPAFEGPAQRVSLPFIISPDR